MAYNIAMPSGYDYEFVQEVPDDVYNCSICHLVMRKPVQTKCGHQFCKECLEEANKRNPQCPEDREPLTEQDIFEDKAMGRRIMSLVIKCPEQACIWQGELRYIENHENNCDYKIVDCDNESCSVRKPRCEMVGHVQDDCLYRIVTCPHCKNAYKFCLLEQHTSGCTQCLLSCPNMCGETVTREQVTSHTSTECPLVIVPCSYQNIGCTIKVQRQLLNDHIENHVKQHLAIAVEKILSIQNQTTTAIENIRKEIYENPTIMTKDYENHYSFIWKLRNLSEQLETARQSGRDIKLYSEQFYTHKYGYKLKLRLDPNGNGGGKGTHVSVYLIVMRGEYDAVLTWPFDWKVRLILMDQKPNPLQRKSIEWSFTPDQSWNSVQRPTTDGNTGVGPTKFVSHETFATENYVADGTLFLKLELEKPLSSFLN